MQDTSLLSQISFRSWSGWKAFFKELLKAFSGHDLMTLAAALAFYTALSLAPLLIITLAVVGIMGESSQAQLIQQIEGLMGSQAASAIKAIVESADDRPSLGNLAGWLGVVALLFSASGVFAQLQASLNAIWAATGKGSKGLWGWIRKRLLSMGLVITLGFLALVSLVASAAISVIFHQEGEAWKILNIVLSFLLFSGVFTLLHKYLPDIKLSWRHAWKGGLATALLFVIGKTLIGLYLGKSAVGSAYGAAGSLVVLLVWVYYSSVIVFTGAEITRLLAAREGSADALSAEPPSRLKPSFT
ncbi:MAG: YihY/virulence factor BrkB family protein [Pseudobdellovibrionaceae bacterium]